MPVNTTPPHVEKPSRGGGEGGMKKGENGRVRDEKGKCQPRQVVTLAPFLPPSTFFPWKGSLMCLLFLSAPHRKQPPQLEYWQFLINTFTNGINNNKVLIKKEIRCSIRKTVLLNVAVAVIEGDTRVLFVLRLSNFKRHPCLFALVYG